MWLHTGLSALICAWTQLLPMSQSPVPRLNDSSMPAPLVPYPTHDSTPVVPRQSEWRASHPPKFNSTMNSSVWPSPDLRQREMILFQVPQKLRCIVTMTPILYSDRYLPAGQSHPQDLGGGGAITVEKGAFRISRLCFQTVNSWATAARNFFLVFLNFPCQDSVFTPTQNFFF